MSDPGDTGSGRRASDPGEPDPGDLDPLEEAARRRRRAQVFGEVLPDSTRDDRDPGDPRDGADAAEEWLRRNVPPHHG